MDPEIKKLEELVRQSNKLAEDTNKTVHKMRRDIWWGRIVVIVWWVAIFGLFGAAYFYFLQPYIQYIQDFWGQAQGWQEQIGGYFSSFRTPAE